MLETVFMEDERPRLRWFRFSLRTLLVAVLVLSLPLSWFAVKLDRARRQSEAARTIIERGGQVVYGWERNQDPFFEPSPTNLRTWLGNDFFDKVELVYVRGTRLECLSCLTDVKDLILVDITDCELNYVKGLSKLETLDVARTQITDAGLTHLRRLVSLTSVNLNRTQITDAGLEHLKGLKNLRRLDLKGTQVTPEGAKKLQEALPYCEIEH